jgi:tetratricopeptide (TPR) repeat protein
MEEAENFSDFTERLGSRVCSESTTPLTEYFACYTARYIVNFAAIEDFEKAGKIPELAKPFLLQTRNRRGQMVAWEEMNQSVLRALKVAPNDWIASHFYLYWRCLADADYPECDTDVRPIETITRSVSENKDLEYFKTFLLRIQAFKLRREGNHQESIDACNQALVLARKYDDQIMVADLLIQLANRVKFTDTKQAINSLISARELCEQLAYRSGYADIQHQLGHIMGQRGELDAAIEHQLQYRGVMDSLSYPITLVNSIIGSYYNQSGNGEKALEFADTAIGTTDTLKRLVSFTYAQKAWALINLGRTDEARDELEQSKRFAMKSGDVDNLILPQIVEGILDKTENQHESAVQTFEEVLRSLEQDPIPLFQNICLLNLLEIEIEKLSPEKIDINADSSGNWMKGLDEHLEKNEFPGIAARSLILKAKLRQKQGRHDEVRKLLKEVLKAAESPSMRYLKDIVVSTFPDVIVT